jgi:DNA-binding winged helix-turn-helix (wHTH) protein
MVLLPLPFKHTKFFLKYLLLRLKSLMGFEGILKMWKVHEKFQSGDYHEVVDRFYGKDGKKLKNQLASVVGALSFLGRIDEAEDLFSLREKSCLKIEKMACRFFLAIGWVRRSEYSKAENLISLNEKAKSELPLERFFHHQGNAFYLFYTGRLLESEEQAKLSRKAAIESNNIWARCLATDALGHVQVRLGAIHAGLLFLEEAKSLAKKMENKSSESAIEISIQCYRWEYGWNAGEIQNLEKIVEQQKPENSYSQATLLLELARQQTLRGNFSAASKSLELAAKRVYASKNRRQEVSLHIRMAELAFRKGDLFQAKHFLWFSKRLLHAEVDEFLELPVIGMQRKISLIEGNVEEVKQLDERWNSLQNFTSTRDRNLRVRLGIDPQSFSNPEDKVHEKLFSALQMTSYEEKIRALLEGAFYLEVADLLKLKPGTRSVALLPLILGVFIQSDEGLEWKNITSMQRKILVALESECSKEQLIEKVWGYSYDPLRHDSMIYAALSGLRKSLGNAGSWVRPTEYGYIFEGKILGIESTSSWKKIRPNPQTEEKELQHQFVKEKISLLNHRQLEILDWMQTMRYLSVKEVRDRFRVSEITALRDLDGLRKNGIVLRIGKARATRYAFNKEIS